MASALAPQCSANWAIKTHTLGAGQFVEFILTREWNESIVLETREWNLHFTYYWWWRWEKEKKKILIKLRMRRGGVTSKKVCLSANEIQQNSIASSREEYWLYWYRFISFTFDLCGLLSFVCHSQNNSWNNITTRSTNQSSSPDSGQILRYQYGISVAEEQTFLLAKRPKRRGARRNGCFRRLHFIHEIKTKDYELIGVNAFPHKIMRFPRILFLM